MDDFQKQLRRLRGNRTFAAAFDKKRTEAEVAVQIRRLLESKPWSKKDLTEVMNHLADDNPFRQR